MKDLLALLNCEVSTLSSALIALRESHTCDDSDKWARIIGFKNTCFLGMLENQRLVDKMQVPNASAGNDVNENYFRELVKCLKPFIKPKNSKPDIEALIDLRRHANQSFHAEFIALSVEAISTGNRDSLLRLLGVANNECPEYLPFLEAAHEHFGG